MIVLAVILFYLLLANILSYKILKDRIIESRKWDLNICCGRTDGGGVNADVKKYGDIQNFKLIKDVYSLPFQDKQFKNVLSSHTIEHLDDPKRFFDELKRVGSSVTLIVPPLWDVWASLLNIWQHKWIFLTFKKKHTKLPKYVALPFAKTFQRTFGQYIGA